MITRRYFVVGGIACTVRALPFASGGNGPGGPIADQFPAKAAFRTFSPQDVEVLNVLGEALVPGSIESGLAQYIDFQLSDATLNCMLMIKYLNVREPYSAFYRRGMSATVRGSLELFAKRPQDLSSSEAHSLVKALSAGMPKGWRGPPSPLFYFVLRGDAVDVTYGTVSGFKQLNVPYLAHIEPPTPWGA